jgi:hypothetical protein
MLFYSSPSWSGALAQLTIDYNPASTASCSAAVNKEVIQISVSFTDISNKLLSVDLANIWVINALGGADTFFQVPASQGGGNTAPLAAFLPIYPQLACDSFVTIGHFINSGSNNTALNPDFDSDAFNNEGAIPGSGCGYLAGGTPGASVVGGGWYNANPANSDGTAGGDLLVPIAQFSVAPGSTITGCLRVNYQNLGQSGEPLLTQNYSIFIPSSPIDGPLFRQAPSDPDNDGLKKCTPFQGVNGISGYNPSGKKSCAP